MPRPLNAPCDIDAFADGALRSPHNCNLPPTALSIAFFTGITENVHLSLTAGADYRMLLADLLEKGRKCYTERKYDEAVHAFTQALEAPKASLQERINVLDLRVGTYVKLSKLDEGFRDAKAMVRQARNDGRGYLRCGQLERLKENYPLAVQWYQHGLRNVSETDRLYPYLQLQLEKAKREAENKVAVSKAKDPLATLPLEVLRMIVSYLDYRQVVGILRVSKAWNRTLSKVEPLIDSIDFGSAQKKVTYHMLKASLARLLKHPIKIVVANLNSAAARYMQTFLEEKWVKCTKLQHFACHDKEVNLTRLRFDRFNLKSIAFGAECSTTASAVAYILEACPALNIARFASICKHHIPPDSVDSVWESLVWPKNMRRLELIANRNNHVQWMPVLVRFRPQCTINTNGLCRTCHFLKWIN